MKNTYVYMLASSRNGTIYIGMTADLVQRVWIHKEEAQKGFTDRYHVYRLVWHEAHDTIEGAIVREKQLKKWDRYWKIRLIEEMNSEWRDLYDDII